MPAANSYIFYHGASLIDGAEIVAIATGFADPSANSKTGAMVQTWILRADTEPHIAARNGADESVCGSCRHRAQPNGSRSCYVRTHEAPLSIYRAWTRGRYVRALNLAELGAGRIVRMGSYGDPAAVPAHIWRAFLSRAAGRTGYTHQWSHSDPLVRANAEALRPYLMASADTSTELRDAQLAGWRTFRVRRPAEPVIGTERVCPASAEAGHLTTCSACRACSGTAGRGHSSIAINAHGNGAVHFNRGA